MKRRESIGLLAGLALLSPGSLRAQERRALRVAGAPYDGFKAIYYGVRSGIFAKYGLTVEIVAVTSGAAASAALISGDVDMAMVNILTLIQAHRRGVAMRMLAPNYWITSEKPTVITLTGKDSAIHTARDLNGKTLGVPGLGDLGTLATRAWIDQNGGDSASLRIIEVPSSAILAAIEQGRIDATTIVEPFVSQALATGKVRVLTKPLDAVSKRFQSGAYVVMEPVVEKNFDTFTRLARGVHEAALYTNTHLAETVELVASYSGATPDVIAKMNRVTDPEYAEPRNVQPVIDVMTKYGALERGFSAEEIISSAALKLPR